MGYTSISNIDPSLVFLMTFPYGWFNFEQFIVWAGVPLVWWKKCVRNTKVNKTGKY